MTNDILKQLDEAEKLIVPNWKASPVPYSYGGYTPGIQIRVSKQEAELACEFIVLMRNNIRALIDCAKALRDIADFKDGPQYHTSDCMLHNEDTEEDGCDCGYWAQQFAWTKCKLIHHKATLALSKLNGGDK